ncbi:unnamed protein product, partial [Meganyctiphanes norvegica]
KYASDKFITILNMLFTAMLKHGLSPNDLLLRTIFSLIKNSWEYIQNSDNYRVITIRTCIFKLFEVILLDKQAHVFHIGDLQFFFKVITLACSFVVQEIINHYVNNNSNVYTVLLDASKAFDWVNYIKLFFK